MTEAEPTLYLFDGYNLLHAGAYADARELRDALAGFVALRGARGVLVFDGAGTDAQIGPLEVRYAASADALLERLAAENRDLEEVCLVSSDVAVRGTSGVAATQAELARRSSPSSSRRVTPRTCRRRLRRCARRRDAGPTRAPAPRAPKLAERTRVRIT